MARRRSPVIAAVALATALATIGVGVAHATFVGHNGRIAFADYMSGQIYAVNPDGSGLAQLTHFRSLAADWPRWSPSGRRLVFDKFNPNTFEGAIWIMNAHGSHERHVVRPSKGFVDQTGTFTPDGRRIVFSRCRGEVCGIWKMRATGTHQRALTPFRKVNETVDSAPSVSPNGRRIVFTRFLNNGIEARVFMMRIDGSRLHPLTPPHFEGGSPDWMPNGHRIVFTSNSFRTGSSVFTIRPGGRGIHRLTPSRYPHNDAAATFSPRGNRIAFISDRNYPDACCNDLFEMGADGSAEQMIDVGLTNPGIIEPAWGTHPLAP
jgi:Tol biopolymer transport system component